LTDSDDPSNLAAMLRTEFPFAIERWSQRLLAFLLGEGLLGFLAILAVALVLAPNFFNLPPGGAAANAIEAAQWAIIAWFAVEYLVALGFAKDRRAFLRNPWRLVDVVTIVVPLASALPGVSRGLRSSPVLRLVRLVRLVTLGVRASGIVVRHRPTRAAQALSAGPAQVLRLEETPAPASVAADWPELLRWLRAREEGWYHVANPSPDELRQLAAAAELPPAFLETNFVAAMHPHLASGRDYAAFFVWLPEIDATGHVDRRATLLIAWKNRLLSLSRRPAHLIERLAPASATIGETEMPFPIRALGELAQQVVRENEIVVARFEQDLHALEEVSVRESRPEFFERTFRLKKELSAAQSDLWRFKAALAELGQRRDAAPGMTDAAQEQFTRLAANAEYLYETIVNTREEVLSVIDLHLNVVSFDMNRVMRLLAVVSCLGLIPAVIGGLFGMNLVDNPWPFTLPQVAFVVCFGMIVGLYFFFVKGWLR
jgi:Mg2+ and Co2+ transporter CorA